MRPVDAAFQVTPEAFDPVGAGTLIADILASPVVHRHVAIALVMQAAVAVQFIGVQLATRLHILRHERL